MTSGTKQLLYAGGGAVAGALIGYFGSRMLKGKACLTCVIVAAVVLAGTGYLVSPKS